MRSTRAGVKGVSALELVFFCSAVMLIVSAVLDLALVLSAARFAHRLLSSCAAEAARQPDEAAAREAVRRVVGESKADGFFIDKKIEAHVLSFKTVSPADFPPDLRVDFNSLPQSPFVKVQLSLRVWVPAPELLEITGLKIPGKYSLSKDSPNSLELTTTLTYPKVDLSGGSTNGKKRW